MIFKRGDTTPPPATTLYQLRQRIASLGDDFWIDNGLGQHVYRVDGKVLRLRLTLVLRDTSGNELLHLQRKLLRLRETMVMQHGGQTVASLHKHLIGLRDRFTIDLADGGELQTRGNFLDHEYTVSRDGPVVAEVSKRWLNIRDTYGISIVEGQDIPLLLAMPCASTSCVMRGADVRALLKILIVGVSLWVTTLIVDGVDVQTDSTSEEILTFAAVGLIFGVVNVVLKPIIHVLGCAFYVLTLGLFALVVNGGLLLLTSWLSGLLHLPFHVDGFWSAVWGSLIISVVSWVLGLFLRV
ncbi:LURP-one-related family protein [Nonomuraea sp. NPDC059194]|uniref:LURP-one-related family protein n=1 Tax=Nonomuraea sp. NPDC059194 TaxID=3346764 RepID=UPI0036779165